MEIELTKLKDCFKLAHKLRVGLATQKINRKFVHFNNRANIINISYMPDELFDVDPKIMNFALTLLFSHCPYGTLN